MIAVSKTKLILVAALCCATVVGWMISKQRAPRVEVGSPSTTGESPASASMASPSDGTRTQAAAADLTAATEPIVTEPIATTADASAGLAPDNIKLAIETTLVNQINPSQFLETALALSKLEISKTPVPEPSSTGEMRYPLLGLPDGVTAELWIGRAQGENRSSPLMTYHFSVDPPDDYVFEGAARHALDGQVYLWLDKQGEVDRFGVLTYSRVDKRSREIGLGWEGRDITTGVHYSQSGKHPSDWTAENLGIRNGQPFEYDGTSVLGQVPNTGDLDQLKAGLLGQYGKL